MECRKGGGNERGSKGVYQGRRKGRKGGWEDGRTDVLYEGRKEKILYSVKGGGREIERERGIETERERGRVV